jgi:class 3 adenylate cyclase
MKCQACGFANPDGFRFCGSCGIALLHETSAEMDAHAERRNITVVFCDLVGSTQLSEQLDDEAFRTVVRAYQSVATAAVEKFGGHVAQHLGDGLMAYFGYPVAHEEDPRRATLAALEICASLPAANEQIRRDHGVELAVRIGIHTGPAIAGDVGGGRFREQLALGRTPNVAARVQAAADPGTVLVSEDTWRLIHGFFDATDLGPTTLKGLATPMALYRIIAPTGARTAFDAARARGLAPLVGRAQEVQHLLDAFRAAAAGTGTTIGLRGEPGIGKSRLADAFRSAAEHAGAVSWLSGQCSPYDQSTAYGPLAAVVADALGIADRDTGEARGTKVRDGLAALQVERPDAVPLLCELLGAPAPDGLALAPMTPVLRKERTLGAMAELVARTASRGPTVVCVEDLHWADPSTLEFLALLAARTSALPMVLLLTARPEFEAPWLPATTVLSLERLPAEASRALAASVAQRQLPDRLSALIHARTDGIPLFVEELTKVIVESGVLDGERAADTAEWEAVIPGSLRDSIAARLDSLGPARRIAQLASVIGRDFGRDLLGIVADDDAHVEAALERLLDAGLAYREGNVEPARYSFKHALVRDAAYESLLRSTRLELHGRVATAIRERFPELRESRPDLVAYHLTEAGARADAIPLWLQAGKGAMDRSANLEAAAFLSRGIAALEDVPESPTRVMQELELQMTLASASMLAGGNHRWSRPMRGRMR